MKVHPAGSTLSCTKAFPGRALKLRFGETNGTITDNARDAKHLKTYSQYSSIIYHKCNNSGWKNDNTFWTEIIMQY